MNKLLLYSISLIFSTFTITAGILHAEALEMPMPLGDTGNISSSIEIPARGMHMSQVEKHFGDPAKQVPAVGQPPITRWIYDSFTVYFEFEYVIHAVAHQTFTPPEPTQPKVTQH